MLLSTKNLASRGTKKLMPKWIGPFPIEAMINPVAARLTLLLNTGFTTFSTCRCFGRTVPMVRRLNPPKPFRF